MSGKFRIPVIVVVLLGVLYGMNAVAQWRQAKAEQAQAAVKKAREDAELKVAKAVGPAPHNPEGKPIFSMPANTGPEDAPVRIEAFLDRTNDCHSHLEGLKYVGQVYGKLVRIVYLDMMRREITERADKLELGCEAGLAVNGQVEMTVQTPAGKRVVQFRGPTGTGKYQLPDVFYVVNAILRQKGIAIPPAAAAASKSMTSTGPNP